MKIISFSMGYKHFLQLVLPGHPKENSFSLHACALILCMLTLQNVSGKASHLSLCMFFRNHPTVLSLAHCACVLQYAYS